MSDHLLMPQIYKYHERVHRVHAQHFVFIHNRRKETPYVAVPSQPISLTIYGGFMAGEE